MIEKVARILLTLEDETAALSLKEVARRTGLPVSTTHRLLGELTARRLLDRDGGTLYRAGQPLLNLRDREIPESHVQRLGWHTVEDLNSIGLPGRIGILREHHVRYIQCGPRLAPVKTFSIDPAVPAAATAAGCALLAFGPNPKKSASASPETVSAPTTVPSRLAAVRTQGFAWSRSECWTGAVALAAPVFGAGGSAIAAVEVPMSGSEEVHAKFTAVQMAARNLSRELTRCMRTDPRTVGASTLG